MTHLEVSKATSYCNIEPVISLFAGVVFLSEPISIMHGLACALVVVGVYMATKD
jgi:drug/metabolite transporter (DMT)-like permease